MVFGRWSLVFGLWSSVFGLWSLAVGLWSLVAGRWSLVFGRLVVGLWFWAGRLWVCVLWCGHLCGTNGQVFADLRRGADLMEALDAMPDRHWKRNSSDLLADGGAAVGF